MCNYNKNNNLPNSLKYMQALKQGNRTEYVEKIQIIWCKHSNKYMTQEQYIRV